VADPKIFISGGKSNDWGHSLYKLAKYGEISFKYEEISQDLDILSGCPCPHSATLGSAPGEDDGCALFPSCSCRTFL
jgi:hypothetical protein